jgi:hypothetical protein
MELMPYLAVFREVRHRDRETEDLTVPGHGGCMWSKGRGGYIQKIQKAVAAQRARVVAWHCVPGYSRVLN